MNNSNDILTLVEKKIYNTINNQFKKFVVPSISLEKVTNLDLQLVKQLKSKYGIGGVILDVDETIRKNMMEVPDCNKQWIKFMKQEFKVLILSNGYDNNVEKFSEENNIDYIGFATKPFKKNFLGACDKMGLNPENVLVIGDDIIADVYGANKCGMITAIVGNVVNESRKELEI